MLGGGRMSAIREITVSRVIEEQMDAFVILDDAKKHIATFHAQIEANALTVGNAKQHIAHLYERVTQAQAKIRSANGITRRKIAVVPA